MRSASVPASVPALVCVAVCGCMSPSAYLDLRVSICIDALHATASSANSWSARVAAAVAASVPLPRPLAAVTPTSSASVPSPRSATLLERLRSSARSCFHTPLLQRPHPPASACVPQINQKRTHLERLRGSARDSWSAFGGPHVGALRARIQANQQRFHRPPVGPLGGYLVLKDQRVRSVRI